MFVPATSCWSLSLSLSLSVFTTKISITPNLVSPPSSTSSVSSPPKSLSSINLINTTTLSQPNSTAMDMELLSGDTVSTATWIKRGEIDTRAPFSSVREAVSLFGERVLAGEVYARNLKAKAKEKDVHNGETNGHGGGGAAGDIAAELEETRQSLQRAREEGLLMESRLFSLREELERTKQELRQLKTNPDLFSSSSSPSSLKHPTTEEDDESDEVVHVKFVANKPESLNMQTGNNGDGTKVELQKKRYVTFASPPSVARVIVSETDSVLQRHPSLKQPGRKKKPLIPLIGGIFSKNKKNSSNPEAHHRFLSSPRVLNRNLN